MRTNSATPSKRATLLIVVLIATAHVSGRSVPASIKQFYDDKDVSHDDVAEFIKKWMEDPMRSCRGDPNPSCGKRLDRKTEVLKNYSELSPPVGSTGSSNKEIFPANGVTELEEQLQDLPASQTSSNGNVGRTQKLGDPRRPQEKRGLYGDSGGPQVNQPASEYSSGTGVSGDANAPQFFRKRFGDSNSPQVERVRSSNSDPQKYPGDAFSPQIERRDSNSPQAERRYHGNNGGFKAPQFERLHSRDSDSPYIAGDTDAPQVQRSNSDYSYVVRAPNAGRSGYPDCPPVNGHPGDCGDARRDYQMRVGDSGNPQVGRIYPFVLQRQNGRLGDSGSPQVERIEFTDTFGPQSRYYSLYLDALPVETNNPGAIHVQEVDSLDYDSLQVGRLDRRVPTGPFPPYINAAASSNAHLKRVNEANLGDIDVQRRDSLDYDSLQVGRLDRRVPKGPFPPYIDDASSYALLRRGHHEGTLENEEGELQEGPNRPMGLSSAVERIRKGVSRLDDSDEDIEEADEVQSRYRTDDSETNRAQAEFLAYILKLSKKKRQE